MKSELNPWKEAVVDQLCALGIYKASHEDDPRAAIDAIGKWNWEAGEYFGKSSMKSRDREA